MAGIKIANGTAASAEATVDTDGNIHVVTPTDITQAGHVALASEQDDGTVAGTRTLKALEATEDFRLRVGLDTVLFNHAFEGTNIARDRLQQQDASMTSAQTNNNLTINSGSSVTTGQGSHIRTYRHFPLLGSFTTYGEFWLSVDNNTATNAVAEWGFGLINAVTTAQMTDGVYLRSLSGGQLRLVITFAAADVATADITTTNIPSLDGAGSFDISETNHYVIQISNDIVRVWINDVLCATKQITSAYGTPTSASQQPLYARVYNTGAASAAKRVNLRFLNVTLGEVHATKPWGHQMTGSGGGAYQIQPGTASGPNVTRAAATTAGWPNSTTARGAGTWTATSAPAVNSLGGQWVSPAISTLTSEADYPVFAYLNPLGTSTLPGRTLYITGIEWGKTVATAAASTNSINLNYIAAVGGTTSSTSTTDSAAAVAPRGVLLDTIPFKATAAIGDYVEGGKADFSQAPLAVYPGCYAHFIVRPYGTVTSNTLVVNGTVRFIGYYE